MVNFIQSTEHEESGPHGDRGGYPCRMFLVLRGCGCRVFLVVAVFFLLFWHGFQCLTIIIESPSKPPPKKTQQVFMTGPAEGQWSTAGKLDEEAMDHIRGKVKVFGLLHKFKKVDGAEGECRYCADCFVRK